MLNFDGPYSLTDLRKTELGQGKTELGQGNTGLGQGNTGLGQSNTGFGPGYVYIYGFAYDDNPALILDPVILRNKNIGNMIFVPYYVGQTTKPIVDRINGHIADIIKSNSTYLRLTYPYMNCFFRDLNFPELRSKQGRWIDCHWFNGINIFNHINGKVAYWNNPIFFQRLQYFNPQIVIPAHGLHIGNLRNLRPGRDVLTNLINAENFYFFYAVVGSGVNLRAAEAYTKYRLQGKTVSDACTLAALQAFLAGGGLPGLAINFINPAYNYLLRPNGAIDNAIDIDNNVYGFYPFL